MDSATQPHQLRILFMGTPDFAVPGLARLIATADWTIVGVYTQTDKPVGRAQLLTPPPIKVLAQAHNLPVFQPLKIKTEAEQIRQLKPDLIIVIAYGKIIPQEILDIPTYGCLNVHASLLPKYRGAACLNAPILYGDTETGVTIMQMEAGLDTGPILRQAKISLTGQETLAMVHDQLSNLGAELLVPTITDFLAGKIKPQLQDEARASYIKTLKKEDGKIDWQKPALEIERLIRAYNPWPGTYTTINHAGSVKNLKILATDHQVIPVNTYKIGEIFLFETKLAVQCGQDALVILNLQLEGKKALTATEFLRGYHQLIDQILS